MLLFVLVSDIKYLFQVKSIRRLCCVSFARRFSLAVEFAFNSLCWKVWVSQSLQTEDFQYIACLFAYGALRKMAPAIRAAYLVPTRGKDAIHLPLTANDASILQGGIDRTITRVGENQGFNVGIFIRFLSFKTISSTHESLQGFGCQRRIFGIQHTQILADEVSQNVNFRPARHCEVDQGT
mmetsp:Transcript_20317/g.32721  ORF Transcript_20317/g.32721 Transcript_20317/m.32721 type:complete len:181 (+) Transcript_20317:53-595(+)